MRVASRTGDGGGEEAGDVGVHHDARDVLRHVRALLRVNRVPNLTTEKIPSHKQYTTCT